MTLRRRHHTYRDLCSLSRHRIRPRRDLVGMHSPGQVAAAGPSATFSWELRPTGTDVGPPRPRRGRREHRLGERQRRHRAAHGRRRRHLAERRPARRGGAGVPRHRGLQRRPRRTARDRPRRCLPRLRHRGRRRDVDEDRSRTPTRRRFYDCMAFFDRHRGLIMGDPVGGKFQILATERRRTELGARPVERDAATRCRASSASPRAAPASRRPAVATRGSAPAATSSPASSTRRTVAAPGTSSRPRSRARRRAASSRSRSRTRATGSSSAATSSTRRTRPTARRTPSTAARRGLRRTGRASIARAPPGCLGCRMTAVAVGPTGSDVTTGRRSHAGRASTRTASTRSSACRRAPAGRPARRVPQPVSSSTR